jgi:Zn-dependent protease
MTAPPQNSLRLFRFAGIEVFLHWSWFVVALIEINNRSDQYSSLAWNVAEYLALFVIVLLHEFGHALACRQVGGQANRIVLWPLGGVAFVAPPQRPGATLWSIAAGPLVNVILLPLAILLAMVSRRLGWADAFPDLQQFLRAMVFINAGLLIFNLLPIYPLDGGQILRALLWFFLGRARSLMAAAVIGLLGVAGLVVFAVKEESVWLGILCVFILAACWSGLLQARMITRIERSPLRTGFACPACHAPPPVGSFWLCNRCRTFFDTFETGAVCPKCQAQFPMTACPQCGAAHAIVEWMPRSTPAESKGEM